MPASAPTTFPYPYHVVMDALPRILPSLSFQVLSQDMAQGIIKVRGTGTLMAAGESLTIRVGTSHPAYSVVQVDSGVRLGLLTYARTSSNFDTILNTLGTYLQQYYAQHRAADAPLPPPPAPAPPPTGYAQQPQYPQQQPPPHSQPQYPQHPPPHSQPPYPQQPLPQQPYPQTQSPPDQHQAQQ